MQYNNSLFHYRILKKSARSAAFGLALLGSLLWGACDELAFGSGRTEGLAVPNPVPELEEELEFGEAADLPTEATADMPTLEGNVLWSGDIVLSESMRVDAACTLQILPGTTVHLQSGVGLFVEGRILAVGSDDEEVSLEGEAANLGLVLLAGSGVEVDGATFDNVRVEIQDAQVETFQNVTMLGSRQSLLVHSADQLRMQDVSVSGGELAMDIAKVRKLHLSGVEIDDAMTAIRLDGAGRDMDVELHDSLVENWWGAGVMARDLRLISRSNRFRGGDGDGLRTRDVGIQMRDTHFFEITGGTGLVARGGSLDLRGSAFRQIDGDGMRLDELAVLIRDLRMNNVRVGIRSSVGIVEVLDSAFEKIGAQALYARSGDVRVIRTTIDDTGSHGIAQDSGTLFLCLVTMTNARRHGVWTDEAVNADIRESAISASGNYGLFLLGEALVLESTITANRRGVYFGGTATTAMRDSTVSNNTELGIHSHANPDLPNLVDIFNGVVRDNGGIGIRDVRLASRVDVGGNNGSTESFDGSVPVGMLDGVFDTTVGDPVQVFRVDMFGACIRSLALHFGADRIFQNLRVNGDPLQVEPISSSWMAMQVYEFEAVSGPLVIEVEVDEPQARGGSWNALAHVLRSADNGGIIHRSGNGEGPGWSFLLEGATEWTDEIRDCPYRVPAWVTSFGAAEVSWNTNCGLSSTLIQNARAQARLELDLTCEEPEAFTPPPPPTRWD